MQNAGQQYGQGGAPSHQTAPFSGHSETTTSGGSITSSLRQFRRKNEDKQNNSDNNNPVAPTESHVARVAPHSHYPPRSTAECYRYPPQYSDYGVQQPVKYSEISEPHPQLQEHTSPTVIQKAKGKEYMEMCNVQQQHLKPTYDQLNGQQNYPDSNIHPHAQYIHKEPQVHPAYKQESQYFPKEPQYCPQTPHQISKYNIPAPVRKYPQENDFLSKLRRIHPSMARSIMSDHHLQESQNSYQPMDQNRIYPHHQNQRYANYPSSMQNNGYPHYVQYTNYNCSYNRPPQMAPRFPSVNPHERSMSPRRGYSDQIGFPMNYGSIPSQKIPTGYSQYNAPEYAQHYQHRRASMAQDYYQQHCSPAQYLAPHQIPPPDIAEGRVTVSDNIKHYIENWADEETATEMNQLENPRICKESIRGRDDQSTETVYMINASELQYLENGLLTSENGMTVPVMTSESGQYIIKNGVSLESGPEMVRIVEKSSQLEIDPATGERVVNLHIMDSVKPDCLLNNKPNDHHLRSVENHYTDTEKPRVVVHQNTVVSSGMQNRNASKDTEETLKLGTSLPLISETLEELDKTIIHEKRKETVDKNCSPINLEEIEKYREEETTESIKSSADCLVEEIASIQELSDSPNNLAFEDAHINLTKTEIITDHQIEHSQLEDPHKDIEILLDGTVEDTAVSQPQIVNNSKIAEDSEKITHVNISRKEKLIYENTLINETEQQSTSSDNISEEINKIPEKIEYKEEERNNTETNSDDTNNQELFSTVDTNNTDKQEKEKELIKSKTEKVVTKRSRRIFSVDDIINNIGKKLKPKESDNLSRRYSLKTTKEFLEMEITNTFKSTGLFNHQSNNLDETITKNNDKEVNCSEIEVEIQENFNDHVKEQSNEVNSTNTSVDNHEIIEVKTDQSVTISKSKDKAVTQPSTENIQKIKCEKQESSNSAKSLDTKEETVFNSNDIVPKEEIVLDTKNDNNYQEISSKEEIILESAGVNSPVLTQECAVFEELSDLIVASTDKETTHSVNTTEDASVEPKVPDQPEVQYRNVIRVEESTVLLEIAGELVEINVNIVNGKNIITVVPLSDTAVVDFNDNYETSETSDATDPLKLDELPQQQESLAEIVDVNVEPEIVETTSEIIIGMDLSLEEEIKLDVDQPPIIFTKAAKKAYDCDLQIPSITTSGDVSDNARVKTYNANDKVSSTKEKSKKIKKKSSKLPNRIASKPDEKSLFRDLVAARNKKKLKSETVDNEEDEFVPFKDLIRARKLRKIKLKEMRNNEDSKVDSTIKIDESNKEIENVGETKTLEAKIENLPEESDNNKKDTSIEEDVNAGVKKSESVSQVVIASDVKKLEDPRLKKQNGNLSKSQVKKKLSLEEYNRRKRKLQNNEKSESVEEKKLKIDSAVESTINPEKIKPLRTKSLDDLNLLKSKETHTKRKLSLEYSPVKQNYFDWEETQSPKVNVNQNNQDNNKLCEFKGLINENNKNKPKVLIDVNDFNCKPSTESSEDEILQNYKDQVESKLNNLNFQIPRPVKSLERQIVDPFLKPETNCLIERFLKNEKLNGVEMEKIRKIISYKRLMQQLKKIKSHDLSRTTSSLNPVYEARKELCEKQTKLLLKKVSEKKRSRFRNLNSHSDSETEQDSREKTRCSGDYSVVQSNCLAGVVPKLIIKRKTEMPLPFVRLERLDLGLFDEKNGRYAV